MYAHNTTPYINSSLTLSTFRHFYMMLPNLVLVVCLCGALQACHNGLQLKESWTLGALSNLEVFAHKLTSQLLKLQQGRRGEEKEGSVWESREEGTRGR